jgi:hypothetical protein
MTILAKCEVILTKSNGHKEQPSKAQYCATICKNHPLNKKFLFKSNPCEIGCSISYNANADLVNCGYQCKILVLDDKNSKYQKDKGRFCLYGCEKSEREKKTHQGPWSTTKQNPTNPSLTSCKPYKNKNFDQTKAAFILCIILPISFCIVFVIILVILKRKNQRVRRKFAFFFYYIFDGGDKNE